MWRPRWTTEAAIEYIYSEQIINEVSSLQRSIQSKADRFMIQNFGDENGEPTDNPRADLHLKLEDFVSETQAKSLGHEAKAPIFISSKPLFEYVDSAKRATSSGEEIPKRLLKPGQRRLYREVTPPEELLPEDEDEIKGTNKGSMIWLRLKTLTLTLNLNRERKPIKELQQEYQQEFASTELLDGTRGCQLTSCPRRPCVQPWRTWVGVIDCDIGAPV